MTRPLQRGGLVLVSASCGSCFFPVLRPRTRNLDQDILSPTCLSDYKRGWQRIDYLSGSTEPLTCEAFSTHHKHTQGGGGSYKESRATTSRGGGSCKLMRATQSSKNPDFSFFRLGLHCKKKPPIFFRLRRANQNS